MATAIERHQGVLRDGRLADRARLLGGALSLLQPLVYAWPAVEMAAERDHRLDGEVQAYVAIKAPIAG